MSQYPDPHPPQGSSPQEPSDKKMMRGSFAISILIHGTILLLLGSIILVPGMVKEMSHIVPVAPPQTIPETPKMEEEVPDAKADDGGGSPLSDVPEPSSAPKSNDATMDALTTVNPANSAPSLNASPGASAVSMETFTGGGKGGSGGGTGTGIGRGAGSGVGHAFKLFGAKEKSENSLIGRFYDLKQDKSRKPLPAAESNEVSPKILREFIASGFSVSKLNKYFSAPEPLYATYIMVPGMSADAAPKAYNVEKEVEPKNWLVHYQAMVAPAVDGTYRFDGVADDFLVVGVNGKVVLDGSLNLSWAQTPDLANMAASVTDWKNKEPLLPAFRGYGYSYPLVPGNWIEWRANDFRKMDIMISERPGGAFCAVLLVEEKGETYDKGADGCPILPLFRVDSATVQMPANIDKTYPTFIMGPIFKARHME